MGNTIFLTVIILAILVGALFFAYKYLNSYTNLNINKYKKYKNYRIIGMGGSVLGSKAIYNFLIHKIKKNFFF